MPSEMIDFEKLISNKAALKEQWEDSRKPFKYLVYDGFFKPDAAEDILSAYPNVETGNWNGTTYVNQKNKFALTKFGIEYPVLQTAFDEFNGSEFLKIVSEITGIEGLVSDDELFGGGLHQSVNGAFLDVHVDFNYRYNY